MDSLSIVPFMHPCLYVNLTSTFAIHKKVEKNSRITDKEQSCRSQKNKDYHVIHKRQAPSCMSFLILCVQAMDGQSIGWESLQLPVSFIEWDRHEPCVVLWLFQLECY